MKKLLLICLIMFSGIASATPYPIGSSPTVIVNAASMTSTVTSPVIQIWGVAQIDCQELWTGTPSGAFAFYVSEDQVNWDPLTLSTTITASGSAGHGTMELMGLAAPYFQVVYTPSAGTGSLTITCYAKFRT